VDSLSKTTRIVGTVSLRAAARRMSSKETCLASSIRSSSWQNACYTESAQPSGSRRLALGNRGSVDRVHSVVEILKLTSSCETVCEHVNPETMLYIPSVPVATVPKMCAPERNRAIRISGKNPNYAILLQRWEGANPSILGVIGQRLGNRQITPVGIKYLQLSSGYPNPFSRVKAVCPYSL